MIDAKLESLRRCLQRLRDKQPASADDLAHDPDLQDIVALNLIRAVQVSADIAAHIVAERARRETTFAPQFSPRCGDICRGSAASVITGTEAQSFVITGHPWTTQ